MYKNWEKIVAAQVGNKITEEDLKLAAYRLISEQVLYKNEPSQRQAFNLVADNEGEFAKVLAPFGIQLIVNRTLFFACAKPTIDQTGEATVGQTLMALVLRSVYDVMARDCQLNENGQAYVDLVDLESIYTKETGGRRFPSLSELEALLRDFKRWGIARKSDLREKEYLSAITQDQPYFIVIQPSIVEILGPNAIHRLKHWMESNTEAIDDNEETATPASAT